MESISVVEMRANFGAMVEQDLVKRGKILLAEPFMLDSYFKRAVVLLCEHEENGSLGFILNKPLSMQLNELLEDFPSFDAPVFYGGPVQTDTIHYLHSLGDLLEGSQEVLPGIFWGGDFNKLRFLIENELAHPHQVRFFCGYSGWSPGQLMEEMHFGSWVLAEMDKNYLFNAEHPELWRQVMENKGPNYSVIAQMPDGINWN